MSNVQVGTVYSAVIDEVLEMSRVDFDENGVAVEILEELRKGWQERLTAANIASFPWDPKVEETPAAQQAGVNNAGPAPLLAPAAAPYTQSQLSPPANGALPLPAMPMQALKPGTTIKTEPGIKQEPGLSTLMSNFQPGPNGAAPQQRAMQLVQAKFGKTAADAISSIHGGIPQPPMPGQPQQQQLMMPQPGAPLLPQAQQGYARPTQPGQAQQRVMPQPGASNGHLPQTDGTGDNLEAVVTKNGVELGRVEIDAMLHEKFAARAKQMEGGGLMLPLKPATKQQGPRAERSTGVGAAQGDAMDDDDDEDVKPTPDDELINSDLDDSDSNQDDDDDDDDMGCVMLCMYDKVQRVKNKWYVKENRMRSTRLASRKCTLKDGVLTVSGREYVFHKATGEYEW